MSGSSEDALKRVGQAVADRRIDVGLETQRELAEAAGVALSTAALLERGRTYPRAGNRASIEDALRWPRGTLEALRRGIPLPQQAPDPPESDPGGPRPAPAAQPAVNRAQMLSLTKGLSDVAATCATILVRYGIHPEAQAALRTLDAGLLKLESLIAASLPHAGDAFDETISALAALHRHRDAINNAAEQVAMAPSGGQRTMPASAKS